jgi:hypothetical protein
MVNKNARFRALIFVDYNRTGIKQHLKSGAQKKEQHANIQNLFTHDSDY